MKYIDRHKNTRHVKKKTGKIARCTAAATVVILCLERLGLFRTSPAVTEEDDGFFRTEWLCKSEFTK